MQDCIFCDKEKIKDDILLETDNFFVKVGLAIISPGHVMLIPKDHYRCFAEIPKPMEKEFQKIKSGLIEKISSKFSKPFLIEYGIFGQSVPHAHIHFIPLESPDYKIKSIMEEMVGKSNTNFKKINNKDLKKLYGSEKAYVTIEENRRLYFFHINNLKEKKKDMHLDFRYFFSNKGLAGIRDWRKMTKKNKRVDEEKRKLTKAAFGNLYGTRK